MPSLASLVKKDDVTTLTEQYSTESIESFEVNALLDMAVHRDSVHCVELLLKHSDSAILSQHVKEYVSWAYTHDFFNMAQKLLMYYPSLEKICF